VQLVGLPPGERASLIGMLGLRARRLVLDVTGDEAKADAAQRETIAALDAEDVS
jgi:hypothetical protein